MDTDFGILLPLWTYAADQGALLDRAVGEVGLDHVTVPVVTGRRVHFRLGLGGETPFFSTDGGWHFQLSTKIYSTCGVRPVKARWLTAADVLARLGEHLERLGVRLLARLDADALRGLVKREPHLCRRNAWGQETPPAGACINNPDCRELLRATLEDLRRYGPVGFELAGWTLDSPARWLPSYIDDPELHDVCMCPACREIAARDGVDVDRVARILRERCLGDAESDDGPLLAAYSSVREADWTRWLRRLDEADPERSYVFVLETPRRQLPSDRLPLPWMAWLRDSATGEGVADNMREAYGVALRPWRPQFGSADKLVRFVSEAARGGTRFFDFETLDEAPPDALTWMKQAVRYARRG